MTSQAIGWNLEDELREIERVLKPNAWAIHLFKDPDVEAGKKIHDSLTLQWKYECTKYQDTSGWKLKYHKTMSS